MARPRKEIDKKQFESLCGLQCTREEICAFFEISEKTLDAWCKRTYKQSFSLVFSQKRGRGKISLRRSQFQLAEKNASMAIWLGKQYLGQRDAPEEDRDGAAFVDNFLKAVRPTQEEVKALYAEEESQEL